MIRIYFEINYEQVTHVRIDASDLTGKEKPTSLKAALMKMDIENPCVTFSREYKAGKYKYNYNLTETAEIADACNFLSDLWRHDYSSGRRSSIDKLTAKMTPIRLLENALTLLLRQQAIISELKRKVH